MKRVGLVILDELLDLSLNEGDTVLNEFDALTQVNIASYNYHRITQRRIER